MGWRLQRYPIFYANSGYEIMPIAHIDIFLNALFNLFTLSALTGTSPPNLPRHKGERLKK